MPRYITAALREATFSAQNSECPILLVTLDHPSLGGTPIRLSSDGVHTTSRGETFVALPFDLVLPDDIDERPPRAQLSVDNVSREIVRFVRGIPPGEAPTVLLELVTARAPDVIEEAWGPFRLSEPDYDAMTVSGELIIDDRSQEPYAEGLYNPVDFPALFVRT